MRTTRPLAAIGLGLALAVCPLAPRPAVAGEPSYAAETPSPGDLVGTWRVDLRPTPDADEYWQEFVVRSVDGHTFEGTFYGTELRDGRLNTDWGAVYFAFVTEDGSGEYHTSGVLKDGRILGTTHSIGREFLAVWKATPAASE
ncbi:MAG: hypothetical protein R3B81_03520 [bacterium]